MKRSPLLACEQFLVVEGLDMIYRQIPIAVLVIDIAKVRAFLNDQLLARRVSDNFETPKLAVGIP